MKNKKCTKIVILGSDERERNSFFRLIREDLSKRGLVASDIADDSADLAVLTEDKGRTQSEGCDAVFIINSGHESSLISRFVGEAHLRVIPSGDTDRLLREIRSLLGVPLPLETEKKYLIKYPDLESLSADPFCRRADIEQTYLKSPEGEERRVRKRSVGEDCRYFKTVKKKLGGMKRYETEERIDEGEYKSLLIEADPDRRTIKKSRYCLLYENRYFEIDVYPFWDDRAILEIELCDEDDEVVLPPMIKVIKEVTDDDRYKNSSLAGNSME